MSQAINVPLELEGFAVTDTELVDGVLEVGVVSTRRPACHHCGSVAVIGHGSNERLIRDRACAHPTVLRWSQRRVRCTDCGRTCRERHPSLAGRRSITGRLHRRLFDRACREPFADVAASEAVSFYRVVDAFDSHAIDHQPPTQPPRVVSLDESAFKKRHSYHTVFSDPERGVIFDLAPGRHKGAALEGLLRLDDQVRAQIETVVIDCHWSYRRAIEELMPHTRIVVDKFHVLRVVDQAAARVRLRHGRRRRVAGRDRGRARQHNPRFKPIVWANRWTFMKRAHKLTPSERGSLLALFDVADDIAVAWLVKEEFAAIYDATDRADAEARFDAWIELVGQAGIKELSDAWRTLQWWREQILNYFDDRMTNGFAEGITNKIKVMKRRSYGFRNEQRYRQKVLLGCSRRRI